MNKFLLIVLLGFVYNNPLNSSMAGWDSTPFTQHRDNQEYTEMMDGLYELLDNQKNNEAVVDWIQQGALAGDVPMMYLWLRNKWIASQCAALGRDEWKSIATLIIISFLRTKQDAYCCEKLGYVRVFKLSEPFSYFNTWRQTCILDTLKQKFFFWFSNRISHSKDLFAYACQQAEEWFTKTNLPSSMTPAWACYCFPTMWSQTHHITFETPDSGQREACLDSTFQAVINRHRADALQEGIAKLREWGDWCVFFADVPESVKPVVIELGNKDDEKEGAAAAASQNSSSSSLTTQTSVSLSSGAAACAGSVSLPAGAGSGNGNHDTQGEEVDLFSEAANNDHQ